MTERAKTLGLAVDARLNKLGQGSRSQLDDCVALLEAGVTVLILVPRDAQTAHQIIALARKRGVKVTVYARPVHNETFDFYVGYDTYKIGRMMGEALAERVSRGDVLILKGDPSDINSATLYDGVMRALQPYLEDKTIRIVGDEHADNWSADMAERVVKGTIERNEGRLDGVVAFNDMLAGAAIDSISELGLDHPVAVVGMDAEVAALRRLVAGTQSATIYMDLHAMATIAADVAGQLVRGADTVANANVTSRVDAYLINGKLITRENLERLLVTPGIHDFEEIYGAKAIPTEKEPR